MAQVNLGILSENRVHVNALGRRCGRAPWACRSRWGQDQGHCLGRCLFRSGL